MSTSSEHTAVTGAPTQVVVRRGDVIGERYEIRGRLRDDAFSHGFLALDQESEEQVLLRVVRSELLETADRNAVVRALRRFVGVGGRFLPGLLDADRDGPFVYATEPVPSGVSFRDVLDGRLREAQPMKPEELLPVIGYLDAALGAIPTSMRHGDVQAELVWIDRDRLELTGAFFVPALPAGAVAAVLQRHGDLRRRYAPELLQGVGGPAADRFGIGAIAHEALTLKPPPPPGESVSSSLGALAAPLAELLHPDLAKRARSLDALLETLSRLSGHPPLELDPGPFQVDRRMRPQRPSSAPPPMTLPQARERRMSPVPGIDDLHTERVPALDAAAADAVLAGKKPTAAAAVPAVAVPVVKNIPKPARVPAATPPVSRAASNPPPAAAAAKAKPTLPDPAIALGVAPAKAAPARASTPDLKPLLPAKRDDEGAHHLSQLAPAAKTPISVPVGLPVPDDGSQPKSRLPSGELDPRLVRAALGVSLDDSEEEVPLDPSVPAKPRKERTQELRLEDLESEEEEVPLDPSVPAKPRKERTQELHLDDLEEEDGEDLHPPTFEGTQNLSIDDLEKMAADHRRAAVPADVKPMPRPRRDSTPPVVKLPALYDDGAQGTNDEPARPRATPVPVVPEAALHVTAAGTNPGAERFTPKPTSRRSTLLWFAIAFGVAIVLGSFAYAAWKRSRAEDLRRQRLQERFEQLQRAE
ncbi:MAG: hypothetical protein H6722_20600 [Sandaracinus sp.]|nr:hypothetical protein [Sandaracinus sp.]